ncbi:MAG: hypothetical protein LBP26_00700 [Clostridiales bacterium]|jgi:hypothetical protein|nr:hypothetical protein [Clostridiales bacterium]
MELIETKVNIRCEMGVCKNRARYTVKLNRAGIGSRIHICESCLNDLYVAIGRLTDPKTPTGASPSAKKSGARE